MQNLETANAESVNALNGANDQNTQHYDAETAPQDYQTEEPNAPEQSASDDVTSEESSEAMPDYMKQHFRRLEKKIKKENRDLQDELAQTRNQLNSYNELFTATYANAYQGQDTQAEPQDEVEAKALKIWKQQEAKQRAESENRYVAQQQAQILSEFKQTIDEACERYDDFEEVVFDKRIPMSQGVAEAAQYLPNAADALYSLAKNPAELKRISSLGMREQIKAVAAYAFSLAKGTANANVTKAPKPVSNSQVKDRPKMAPTTSTMSYEQLKEHLRKRNKRATPKR
jgi:hypothetical protein